MNWDIIIEKFSIGFAGAGIFGPILRVSAMYMFLFMLFAALVESAEQRNFSTSWGN